MKQFLCIHCQHEVYANHQPSPIDWTDGHTCTFRSPSEIDMSLVTSFEDLMAALEKGGIDLSDGDFPEKDLRLAYETEIMLLLRYALPLSHPKVILHPFRTAGSQHIAEFEVKDTMKTDDPSRRNFHGQNTSQWVYAGCVLYDERDNRVSRHH